MLAGFWLEILKKKEAFGISCQEWKGNNKID
jgi:hypothetical protein